MTYYNFMDQGGRPFDKNINQPHSWTLYAKSLFWGYLNELYEKTVIIGVN